MSETSISRKVSIMTEAQRLFASNGYNGTSVDKIAEAAGVNKATIYYYFKSKREILEQMIDDFFKEMLGALMSFYEKMLKDYFAQGMSFNQNKLIVDGSEHSTQFLDFYEQFLPELFDFFEDKRDILRIMMMESIKEGKNSTLIFRFTDLLNMDKGKNKITDLLETSKVNVVFDQETLVAKFFGGILPSISYAIFCDSWARHYETTKHELRVNLAKFFRTMVSGYIENASADGKGESNG